MLTLLLGTDWTANQDAVLDMLAQDVIQQRKNRILIVPELISHDTERRLCMAAGDTASRFAEVLTFTICLMMMRVRQQKMKKRGVNVDTAVYTVEQAAAQLRALKGGEGKC